MLDLKFCRDSRKFISLIFPLLAVFLRVVGILPNPKNSIKPTKNPRHLSLLQKNPNKPKKHQ